MGEIDMRTFKIIGLAGFALLCVSSLLVVKSAMAIEKAKYKVIKKEDGFELRTWKLIDFIKPLPMVVVQ